MKLYILLFLILSVVNVFSLPQNFYSPIDEPFQFGQNHIQETSRIPPAVPKFPVIVGVSPAHPKNPDGSYAVSPPVPSYTGGGHSHSLAAVPKNPDGTPRIPPAQTKNPGNKFGAAVPKFADDSSPVAPALPKNEDGTPALSTQELLRVSLCKNVSANLRYDNKTKRCYQVTSSGPCGDNMRFYASNAIYGDCDCLSDTDVPLVYHPRSDKCYYIYRQAYCRRKQWLIFDRQSNSMVCSPNSCFNSGLKTQPWSANIRPDVVPLNGNGMCVRLMSGEGCSGDEIVQFGHKRVVATCSNETPGGLQTKFLSPVGILPCPAGSKPSMLGNCNPDIDWDF